jgi:hypothetical protein
VKEAAVLSYETVRTITIGEESYELTLARWRRKAFLSSSDPANRVRKSSCRRRLRLALKGTGVRFDCCWRPRRFGSKQMTFFVFSLPGHLVDRQSNSKILDLLEEKLCSTIAPQTPIVTLAVVQAA